MKLIFFILTVLHILIYSSSKIIKKQRILNDINYLTFSFKRNLTINEGLKPEELFKELFYNQIYINIKVGSEKTVIPFYLHLQQFPTTIESNNVEASQVKGIFNELLSNTFQNLNEPNPPFVIGDIAGGFLAKDNFYFNNENNKFFMNFYLCTKNHENTHITEGGIIGFKLSSEHVESDKSCFITNLKQNNLISNYLFSFVYDSKKFNEETGKLYIGANLHLIDKQHFNEEFYINDKADNYYSNIEWVYSFNEIKIGDQIIENNSKAFFYIEIGFIIGTQKYFDYIKSLDTWKQYFKNNNKCYEKTFTINDIEANEIEPKIQDDYIAFYCDKDVDVSKINLGNLLFIKKEKNFSFNFTSNDLWIEKNEYKIFTILQKVSFFNDIWYFGKPIFKKYPMVFDYSNKQIGFYTQLSEKEVENNNKSNIFVYVIIIIGLIIIIAVLIFLLIKCYINLPRKKRANEMNDDNYEYDEIN